MLNSTAIETITPSRHNLSDIDLDKLSRGFIPAFRDLSNDETHLSTTEDGEIAEQHLLLNLPLEWVEEWNNEGYAVSLKQTVILGYLRAGSFYTLFDLLNIKYDA